MNNFILSELFATLNIFILERRKDGFFRINGTPPDWVERFCARRLTSEMDIFIPQTEFPFLGNFLIDAEEFWQSNSSTKLSSGLWSEVDLTGKEYQFEAYAISMNNREILLIELLGEKFIQKQSLIQKARNSQLDYQHLLKETERKDVLIHCIIHDIAGQLSAINCCLALLEFENLSVKGKEFLEIGRKQSIQQEMLIKNILDVFSNEVRSLEAFTVDVEDAPNILSSAQEVIELSQPTFILNNKQLQLTANINIAADWKVVGEKSRLDRLILNLVENAYRYSPLGSTVTIDLQPDGEYILLSVDDEGSGVPAEIVNTLFQKFSQGKHKSGRVGLGLYFCRITVEHWGGTIGYLPRQEGGSRFWFRLPRPIS
ncbi:HAMP domain-containing histidine kinase [Nostocaceae cyanobacterium CENA369]|uniref:histidine kinase n=1 Tax=Dendronalium phyllosphericum CENA369 TaxID=1725256 RepID=A0A8J7HWM0_9NOST|nr:HAMP domain-containing sensor histidine kinase [Dendronalium phyllosphericum]MBH8571484.1 HAMP domain-containing histidine kinase [Dendronalium phyllosphericum CENA369]